MKKRAEITADKLETFISASTLICNEIEKDNFDINSIPGQRAIISRVLQVSNFLNQVDKCSVINAKLFNDIESWVDSYPVFKEDTMSGFYQMYSADEKVKVVDPKQYFKDAVLHVVNMAEAILNEPNQLQPVKLIKQPYGQNDWLPAKLTQ